MPTITFEGPNPMTVDAPEGGALVDLCDEKSAPVPFSCRSASCATCRLEVLEGAQLFEEAQDEELAILDVFGAGPDEQRLACQARLKAVPGRVRVKAFNNE